MIISVKALSYFKNYWQWGRTLTPAWIRLNMYRDDISTFNREIKFDSVVVRIFIAVDQSLIQVQEYCLKFRIFFCQFYLSSWTWKFYVVCYFNRIDSLLKVLPSQSSEVSSLLCFDWFCYPGHVVACTGHGSRGEVSDFGIDDLLFAERGQFELFAFLLVGSDEFRVKGGHFGSGDEFIKGEAAGGLDFILDGRRGEFGPVGSNFGIQGGAEAEVEGLLVEGILVLGDADAL